MAHGDGRLVWGGVDLQAAWFGYSPTAVLLQATAAAIIVLGGRLLTMRVQPYAHTAQNRLEAGLSVAAAAFIFLSASSATRPGASMSGRNLSRSS